MQPDFPIPLDESEFEQLLVVPNPGGERQSIQIIDPEFSAVCPRTGLPDFGRVILQYVPDEHVLELKAYKLYLRCYYGVGMMHEPVTHKIASDIIKVLKPKMMRLVIDWGARGGLKTVTGIAWTPNRNFYALPDHWFHESYQRAITHWTNE